MFLLLLATVFAIDVNVMLPLDVINSYGIQDRPQLVKDLDKLKSAGVVGVMGDVWWGLVETSPKTYKWDPYLELVQIAKDAGLKFQPVMSFHKCGGNVGDTCDIPIPEWVIEAGELNDAFFKDKEGNINNEYISFAADDLAVFNGRTPLEMYKDYMDSFQSTFRSFINSGQINEIQVGLGPCGETRYPSYPSSQWQYCGIGEFQCSDANSISKLQQAATSAGNSEWGVVPEETGNYNTTPPSSTGFFGSGQDNYQSDYGKFFLSWYNGLLFEHANNILSDARSVFGSKLPLAAKVSGIHWWYKDYSHAAELTAGYYNTNSKNAYLDIANLFALNNARFDFTCLEMTGVDWGCGSDPTSLVDQAYVGAQNAGLEVCGENAIDACENGYCDQSKYNQIIKQAKWYQLTSFTYLRMTMALLYRDSNFEMFKNFVQSMNN
ncbi:Beta-amylase [Entamoeba marina]